MSSSKAKVRRSLLSALTLVAFAASLLLWPLRVLRRTLSKTRRSIWTGTPIITIAINARAERMLGYDARSVVTQTYFVTRAFDHDLSRWRNAPLVGPLVPFALFVWACVAADRLHFFCDQGILPVARRFLFRLTELYAYRLVGIEVFLWTYGADVRTRGVTTAWGDPNCCTDCDKVGMACVCDDILQRSRFRAVSKLATAVFSMGDMTAYAPGSRNDLFFWPIDLEKDAGARYAPAYPGADARAPLRIVHAPNHRVFKGTKYLEAAVAELRAEGEAIELVMVEGLPNDEALRIYRSADVVFDQCLVGFHGYFALEAMALGKPVMCFIRDRSYLLAPDECPIINVHVRTLKEDIRRQARERTALPGIGQRGRAYIEKHFSVPAFSARLARAYQDLGIYSPATVLPGTSPSAHS